MSDEFCASCLVTICKFRFPQLDERERDLEGKWRTPAGSLACWWWLAHHFFRHEKLSPAPGPHPQTLPPAITATLMWPHDEDSAALPLHHPRLDLRCQPGFSFQT